MAEEVVSAVINKTVDIAANFIVDESSRLYWLPEDIRWLEQQMRLIQAYLDDAEAKRFTNPKVATLIKNIRDLAHDVEDIFDTFLPRIESHRAKNCLKRTVHILPYGHTCSQFSRAIEKIKKRVEGIDMDRKNYGVEDIPDKAEESNAAAATTDPRPAALHFDDPIIIGFDRDIEELKTKLKEHHFVSIVGMPGLGKTTLAKKVFKEIKNGFDCSASVTISQQPNIKSLLQDTAKQVGLEIEKEKQEDDLKVSLFSFLQEKRYILLLDDIWHPEAWDSLKMCFPTDHTESSTNTSRIIITSRNTGVGRYIGGQDSLHQLQPFDNKTSWELFSKLMTNKELDHAGLGEIGQKIVEKCDGVPLAIVVTAGMLRERGMSEFGWNEVLTSIGQDASDKCSQILGLSYKDLPKALKPCFLYFGNFPEDHEFYATHLIRMWMAEKFVLGIGAHQPEDVGQDYISKLDARNLIQVVKRGHDGRIKRFRVHDLLQSLCVNMGREIDFLDTIDHLEASFVMKVRRLAIQNESITGDNALKYEMPKLRALFHFNIEEGVQMEHLKKMLGTFRLLRVLILVTWGELLLPTEIGSLSCLHCLQLHTNDFVEIPLSIQNLKNLQTLDVGGFLLLKLPIGIWKMKKLRHLLIEGRLIYHKWDYYLMRLQRQVEVFLPNIQTLVVDLDNKFIHPTMLPEFTNLRKLVLWGVTPEAMEILCGGREPISKKLETLHCWGSGSVVETKVNLSQHTMLMELKIGGMKLKMPQPLDLPPSLLKLTLRKTQLFEDSMETLRKLPKLKILKFHSNSYCGSKMDCSGADSLPQLEVLKLNFLRELEELIEGEDISRGMPKLKKLSILECGKLTRILKRLQQLAWGIKNT